MVALADPEMKGWSNGKIAEWCGVHDTTVMKLRPTQEPDSGTEKQNLDPPKVRGKDGKLYPAPCSPPSCGAWK